jgi:hypothetical protein
VSWHSFINPSRFLQCRGLSHIDFSGYGWPNCWNQSRPVSLDENKPYLVFRKDAVDSPNRNGVSFPIGSKGTGDFAN